MRGALVRVLSVAGTVLAVGSAAEASGPLLFQHGARGAAQVGAFTARADQPLAITYNPAAIARLEGLQFQAGLDFTAPRDDYKSATGGFAQDHRSPRRRPSTSPTSCPRTTTPGPTGSA